METRYQVAEYQFDASLFQTTEYPNKTLGIDTMRAIGSPLFLLILPNQSKDESEVSGQRKISEISDISNFTLSPPVHVFQHTLHISLVLIERPSLSVPLSPVSTA